MGCITTGVPRFKAVGMDVFKPFHTAFHGNKLPKIILLLVIKNYQVALDDI